MLVATNGASCTNEGRKEGNNIATPTITSIFCWQVVTNLLFHPFLPSQLLQFASACHKLQLSNFMLLHFAECLKIQKERECKQTKRNKTKNKNQKQMKTQVAKTATTTATTTTATHLTAGTWHGTFQSKAKFSIFTHSLAQIQEIYLTDTFCYLYEYLHTH